MCPDMHANIRIGLLCSGDEVIKCGCRSVTWCVSSATWINFSSSASVQANSRVCTSVTAFLGKDGRRTGVRTVGCYCTVDDAALQCLKLTTCWPIGSIRRQSSLVASAERSLFSHDSRRPLATCCDVYHSLTPTPVQCRPRCWRTPSSYATVVVPLQLTEDLYLTLVRRLKLPDVLGRLVL